MPKSVFEQIKKQNGEKFAKAIRNYDNGVFEIPKIVDIVKYAGTEAEIILPYLISLKDIKIEKHVDAEDPLVLLDKAGYNAYYVNTLDEQNAISEYFSPKEMLCTFHDPTRFQRYHIINAVKKDVAKIRRVDFIGKEEREDLYGTSVISIQVLTTGGFISIKNRYNHTVENPDNTFNSNPDNIIPGLSAAIEQHFNVDFSSQKVVLPNNFKNIDNQIIHYNYEVNNIYFGENFYAKDGHIYPTDKDFEIILDTCILNLKDRTIRDPSLSNERFKIDEVGPSTGNFMSIFANELKGKKLQLQKNKADNSHELFADKEKIAKIQRGMIIELNLPNVTQIGDGFLRHNTSLAKLTMPKIQTIGNVFLPHDDALKEIDFPNLRSVGIEFLYATSEIEKLNLPKLESVGTYFLHYNQALDELDLPNLKIADRGFMTHNRVLTILNAPKLESAGDYFLYNNLALSELNLPSLQNIGTCFLSHNEIIDTVNMPNLQTVGNEFLSENKSLTKLCLPKLQNAGYFFLNHDDALTDLELPEVKTVENYFLYNNHSLSKLNLLNLETTGIGFLAHNETLESLDLPKLKITGRGFLNHNNKLTRLNLPSLKEADENFLRFNQSLTELNLPSLEKAGDRFLINGKVLTKINLPKLQTIGDDFLYYNETLTDLNLPSLQSIGDTFLKSNTHLQRFTGKNISKDIEDKLLKKFPQLQIIDLAKEKNQENISQQTPKTEQSTPTQTDKKAPDSALLNLVIKALSLGRK